MFYETSAKEGNNVKIAFTELSKELMIKKDKEDKDLI